MEHVVPRISSGFLPTANWHAPAWQNVPMLSIDQFHPRSSDHHPITHVRLIASPAALHIIFHVQDRYVRSVARQYQDSVCEDACVELFVEPKKGRGYFNFEINCGGVMLLHHVIDPTRTGIGCKEFEPVAAKNAEQVAIATTMPRTTPQEIATPITWVLEAAIPLGVFEPYIGPVQITPGGVWRANFYKCASNNSHPHWGAWSSIGDELNFHQPGRFGELRFAP